MRILITGTESTGKSTLAKRLSAHLGIAWIPEYARTYLEVHGPSYKASDLLSIAQEQHNLVPVDDQAFILDTYLLNIKIWSEEKYGRCDPWITDTLAQASFDRVLLTAPDLPWIQDDLRENPTAADRLHQRFISELNDLGWPYAIISGRGQQRLHSALAAIK